MPMISLMTEDIMRNDPARNEEGMAHTPMK
jgi:hypothetical protein